MKYRDVYYSVAEDHEPPYLWRYTIFFKSGPGAQPRTSFGYSTHADAETACKTEIDRSLSGDRPCHEQGVQRIRLRLPAVS